MDTQLDQLDVHRLHISATEHNTSIAPSVTSLKRCNALPTV